MKKITSHLQYNLWIYLLIALLAIVFWVTVFGSLASPEDNEKITILYFGSDLDSNALQEDISEKISLLTEQNIKQVSIDAVDTRNYQLIHQLLPTRIYDTDLIIISQSVVEETSCKTFFPSIPVERMNGLNIGEYYYEDEQPYGILLNGGNGENNFSAFYSGDERYYVFFSSSSVNLNRLFSVGEYGDDAALAVLKYLLE